MKNAVQTTAQTLALLLEDLQAQKGVHEAMVAQIDGTIEKLAQVAGEIDESVSATEGAEKPKKRGRKPGTKASTKAGKAKPGPKAKRGPKAAPKAAPTGGKLDASTEIGSAGFSPRIVKLCKSANIATLGDLAKHNIRGLAGKAARIGEGAIQEMLVALKRAGLKSIDSQTQNGAAGAEA